MLEIISLRNILQRTDELPGTKKGNKLLSVFNESTDVLIILIFQLINLHIVD